MERIELIERMNMFAADTKNDALSVMVARVAARLGHADMLQEQPLTQPELRIIKMFESKS